MWRWPSTCPGGGTTCPALRQKVDGYRLLASKATAPRTQARAKRIGPTDGVLEVERPEVGPLDLLLMLNGALPGGAQARPFVSMMRDAAGFPGA